MKPSLRYVVEGFVCVIWTSSEPYRTELDRFYIKNNKNKNNNFKNYKKSLLRFILTKILESTAQEQSQTEREANSMIRKD